MNGAVTSHAERRAAALRISLTRASIFGKSSAPPTERPIRKSRVRRSRHSGGRPSSRPERIFSPMIQSDSHDRRDVFADFRSVTEGLGDLSAGSRILALEFELFQAMKRAVDADERCGRLERKLDDARIRADVYAERVRELCVRAAGDRASIKAFYERELRLLQEAYAAVKQRCRTLDDLCRSLLLTIAWCAGHILQPAPPEAYGDRYKTWRLDTLNKKRAWRQVLSIAHEVLHVGRYGQRHEGADGDGTAGREPVEAQRQARGPVPKKVRRDRANESREEHGCREQCREPER